MIQRVAVAGGAVALLSVIIGLSIWLGRPEYRVLYSNLGPEDASHVVKALQTDKIPYQLADNGATIRGVRTDKKQRQQHTIQSPAEYQSCHAPKKC